MGVSVHPGIGHSSNCHGIRLLPPISSRLQLGGFPDPLLSFFQKPLTSGNARLHIEVIPFTYFFIVIFFRNGALTLIIFCWSWLLSFLPSRLLWAPHIPAIIGNPQWSTLSRMVCMAYFDSSHSATASLSRQESRLSKSRLTKISTSGSPKAKNLHDALSIPTKLPGIERTFESLKFHAISVGVSVCFHTDARDVPNVTPVQNGFVFAD